MKTTTPPNVLFGSLKLASYQKLKYNYRTLKVKISHSRLHIVIQSYPGDILKEKNYNIPSPETNSSHQNIIENWRVGRRFFPSRRKASWKGQLVCFRGGVMFKLHILHDAWCMISVLPKIVWICCHRRTIMAWLSHFSYKFCHGIWCRKLLYRWFFQHGFKL